MFMRGCAYLLTTAGVTIVVGIVTSVILAILGVHMSKAGLITIFTVSLIMGCIGSVISLFASKFLVKKTMNVQVITNPQSRAEKWLCDTVALLAQKKGVKMPEVGIYYADEMNAFATGWNRNDALVAVSSGLLDHMEQDEIEAVLGHEMSHVANGDMVTQCLVQGVVNTFVYALSYIGAQVVLQIMQGNNNNDSDSDSGNSGSSMSNFFIYNMLVTVFQTLFGFLGTIVVMWFSRWREYHADRGSAEVLGADSMIKALQALQGNHVSAKPQNVSTLCIAGISNVSELFMTHPPIDKRIAALRQWKQEQ